MCEAFQPLPLPFSATKGGTSMTVSLVDPSECASISCWIIDSPELSTWSPSSSSSISSSSLPSLSSVACRPVSGDRLRCGVGGAYCTNHWPNTHATEDDSPSRTGSVSDPHTTPLRAWTKPLVKRSIGGGIATTVSSLCETAPEADVVHDTGCPAAARSWIRTSLCSVVICRGNINGPQRPQHTQTPGCFHW